MIIILSALLLVACLGPLAVYFTAPVSGVTPQEYAQLDAESDMYGGDIS